MSANTKTRLILIVVCLGICLPAVAQVQSAKLLGDGASVQLSSKMVTYATTSFFYIQDDNHGTAPGQSQVGGIRVAKASHGFSVGARVNVSGVMRTDQDMERYIDCSSATLANSTSATVVPWLMNNKTVGGSDWNYNSSTNAGQAGVDAGTGLNNIGMLVRTTGTVTYVDPTWQFVYIDDGSALCDGNTLGQAGSSVPGLRVMRASTAPPAKFMCATVTGISSIESVGGLQRRAILATALSEVQQWPLMSLVPMACVPGGSFLMGNSGVGDDADDGYPREYPQHTVDLPTFWISKTEVTRAQYRLFVNAGGYSNSAYWSTSGWGWKQLLYRTAPDFWADAVSWGDPFGSFAQGDSRPVVGVSHYEAEAFCNWAGGRLPTEAEWEKAARWDGTPRIYPWGDVTDKTKSSNWYDTAYPGFQTAPVTSFSANVSPYGCSDMAGNVWEWTQDWYKSYPGSLTPFDKTGVARALRGGGWYGAYGDRCASRWFAEPGYSDNDVGFRIAH